MKKYLFIVLLVFFWSCEEDNCEEIYELSKSRYLAFDVDDNCNIANFYISYRDELNSSTYYKIEDDIAIEYSLWSNEITNKQWLQYNGTIGENNYSTFEIKDDSLFIILNDDSCSYNIPSLKMNDDNICVLDADVYPPVGEYYYDCSLYPNKYVKICNPYQIGIPE